MLDFFEEKMVKKNTKKINDNKIVTEHLHNNIGAHEIIKELLNDKSMQVKHGDFGSLHEIGQDDEAL